MDFYQGVGNTLKMYRQINRIKLTGSRYDSNTLTLIQVKCQTTDIALHVIIIKKRSTGSIFNTNTLLRNIFVKHKHKYGHKYVCNATFFY